MLLRQGRLRWLGHMRRIEDGQLPKDILYSELASGKRPKGDPQLRCKGVKLYFEDVFHLRHFNYI